MARLAPFDRSAHELLLTSLARQDRIAEGEAHLASAVKLFEADGLESAPLRDLWRHARGNAAARAAPGPRTRAREHEPDRDSPGRRSAGAGGARAAPRSR